MSGYLQRLLDTAAPGSEPSALTPVVKSTSPIFEQNQLPGLAGLYAGEGEGEALPQVADAPETEGARAPTPLPPAAAPAIPTSEIIRRDPLRVTPTPSPRPPVGRSAAETPLPRLRSTVEVTAPLPPQPADTTGQSAPPDPEVVATSLRLETVVRTEPERDAPVTLKPLQPVLAPAESVFAPAASERVARGPTPAVGPGAAFPSEDRVKLAAAVSLDESAEPAPIESVGNAPLRPVALEPRPRPDFDDADPDADQPRPEPQQAPRITIGRVTVALEPDPGPAARPVRAARNAAAASVIGPLGNRRARRRLFALARL
jgi:hypothetical protein